MVRCHYSQCFLRAGGRIISYIASIFVLETSSYKSSFTNLFTIRTFISINPSCGYLGLTLAKNLYACFIFNPTPSFLPFPDHHLRRKSLYFPHCKKCFCLLLFARPHLFAILILHTQSSAKSVCHSIIMLQDVLASALHDNAISSLVTSVSMIESCG